MKRSYRYLALASVAALLLGAANHADALTRGGKMVYARNADSLFLDPVLLERNVDIWVLTNLYDTLLQPSADGKSADGTPRTVDDVKWSLDRARDPNNGAWNFTLASVDSVETKGDDTVVLHLKNPDPALAAALAVFNSSIMSKKLFEAAPGATD